MHAFAMHSIHLLVIVPLRVFYQVLILHFPYGWDACIFSMIHTALFFYHLLSSAKHIKTFFIRHSVQRKPSRHIKAFFTKPFIQPKPSKSLIP